DRVRGSGARDETLYHRTAHRRLLQDVAQGLVAAHQQQSLTQPGARGEVTGLHRERLLLGFRRPAFRGGTRLVLRAGLRCPGPGVRRRSVSAPSTRDAAQNPSRTPTSPSAAGTGSASRATAAMPSTA